MLKGFTVPRSPLGRAALNPSPPWHYSGDVIAIEFWADPKVTASLLPEGFAPDPQTNGRAYLMFIDWQFTAQNEEYLDPARYQYREAFVLIDARVGDMAVEYCPYIYVDNDAALARGWIQGFPKKLASVFQTRTYLAPSAAQAPIAAGSQFGASFSVHGQRLADARLTLREPVKDPFTIFNRPMALVRYFPRLTKADADRPAVNEIAISLTDDLHLTGMWSGDASVSFADVDSEELNALKPTRVGKGYRYGMSYTVSDLKILKDFTR